ncbi:MAG: FKBP-type peptidyl-prolyl cis-trans isomerase [Candidatus Latescibacterota bacterium]|nr:FKBP-type peptidyl-prolyl cis-trans isomerase [Candidatus Latescibacterota bacterium]
MSRCSTSPLDIICRALLALTLSLIPVGAQTTATDSTLYALGQGLAKQFSMKGLFTAEELEVVQRGLHDGVIGEGNFDIGRHLDAMNALMKSRKEALHKPLQDEGAAFLAAVAKEPGAVITSSGLIYFQVREGSGESPGPHSTVVAHYKGTLTDGTVFDSSYERGDPSTFALTQVIKGWQQGLPMMKVGGKAKFVIPAGLAYGKRGSPPTIPPDVPLVFEIELVAVK